MSSLKLKKGENILIEHIEPAFSLFSRMRGLLGRTGLEKDHALYIKPCNSIHTFFMRFELDLIFLDKNLKVVRIVRNVAPNKMVMGGKHAASVIEMESGWFDWNQLGEGDVLEVV